MFVGLAFAWVIATPIISAMHPASGEAAAAAVEAVFTAATEGLAPEDARLPQVTALLPALRRGIPAVVDNSRLAESNRLQFIEQRGILED